MGLDMIRYDWYRVAPAQLGNFLKSLSRYEILWDQSTTFGQHFSGSCSSRCCQTALLRPTVYSHFRWRCGMPKELWWVSVNFQGKCGIGGKCLWVICIHLISFVFICIHLCFSERTSSICTVKIISGIALTPISFRVCPCWCRQNAARSASLNWPDGREFASKGGGACPVGAVACGCGNEGSKWPLRHPQTTTPAVRCNAIWSRNPGCAFKVGSLGHEPPQKDTHSEFHLKPDLKPENPKPKARCPWSPTCPFFAWQMKDRQELMGARFIHLLQLAMNLPNKHHRLEDALSKKYETVLQKKVEQVMADEMTKSVSALEFWRSGQERLSARRGSVKHRWAVDRASLLFHDVPWLFHAHLRFLLWRMMEAWSNWIWCIYKIFCSSINTWGPLWALLFPLTLQSAEMVSFKAESMLVQSEQKGPLSSGLKKSMTAEQPTSIKIRWKVKELQGTH